MNRFKQHISYLHIQIKNAFTHIPKLILCMLCFGVLLAGFAFAGSRLLYRSEALTLKVNIALVANDDNPLVNLAVLYIKNLESVENVCDFFLMSEADAMDSLEDGTVYAVVILPPGFINDILNGINTPARIILHPDSGADSILFETLAEAAAYTLRTAQAGIYAAIDTINLTGNYSLADDMTDSLNSRYISMALGRPALFKSTVLSATEEFTLVHFYGASAFVLLMLLTGIGCAAFCRNNTGFLTLLVKRSGIGLFAQAFWQTFGLTVCYFSVFAVLVLIYGLLSPSAGLFKTIFILLPALFLIIFSICSFSLLLFRAAKNPQTGILLLFMFSVILIFLSGGILPPAFLPQVIRRAGSVLPSTYWLKSVAALTLGRFRAFPVFISTCYSFAFILLNYLLCRTETK